jgi:ABC-type glycerol-3-phosphate transport system substrate-binding protein
MDLNGVNAKYWNTINVQSESASQTSQEIADTVSSKTGANISVNMSTIGDLIGANWKQSFRSGNYPVVLDSVVGWAGPFFQGGFVKPYSEYEDQLDDDVVENIQWLIDRLDYAYRGYRGGVMEVPYGINVQCGLIGRMDHFEEAGLSPEDDFPPENFDDLIQTAKTLQEDGPGEHGFSAYGDASDTFDEHVLAWAMGNGGEDGVYLNEDLTESIVINDVWQDAMKKYIETFTVHDLGPDNTPSISTEEFVTQVATGRASMSGSGFLNLPLIRDRAPDLVEDGTIRWAPMWKGDAGYRGATLPYTLAITRKPGSVDQSTWDRRQQVGIEVMNEFLSKEVQRNLFENFGLFPVRKDVWSDLPIGERNDNYLQSFQTMSEEGGPSWSAHPISLELIINIAPPHIQDGLRGNISPSQVLQNIKEDADARL